jgi:hypothetical protein
MNMSTASISSAKVMDARGGHNVPQESEGTKTQFMNAYQNLLDDDTEYIE